MKSYAFIWVLCAVFAVSFAFAESTFAVPVTPSCSHCSTNTETRATAGEPCSFTLLRRSFTGTWQETVSGRFCHPMIFKFWKCTGELVRAECETDNESISSVQLGYRCGN